MDKVRAAADKVLHKAGHHDTTVHEAVAPAVTHETVTKQHHEEVQKAIDREVHQDHYHTTVQPVQDREVLPEQHTLRQAPTEHIEHHHGKDRAITDSLKQERAHFHDTTTQGQTTETRSSAPTVAGEHRHHHVHETIQPVVQKETIQPSVVHTTVPVHEVHHNDPKHHAASALPAVSMADFKKQGGTLTGRAERSDAFEGEPNSLASTGSAAAHSSGSHGNATGPHSSNFLNKADPRVDSDRDGSSNGGLVTTSAPLVGAGSTGTTGTHGTTAGPHSSNTLNKADPRVDSDRDGSSGLNRSTPGHTGATGYGTSSGTGLGSGTGAGPHGSSAGNKIDPRVDSDTGLSHGTTGTSSNTTTTGEHKKASLLDKLNPKKDSDGDGKAGFFK